jgi:hypothetical protein
MKPTSAYVGLWRYLSRAAMRFLTKAIRSYHAEHGAAVAIRQVK